MVEAISWALLFAHLLIGFLAAVFFISGLDDLFIDINFVIRRAYRRLFVLSRHKPLSATDLLAVSEKAVAIMVPAWDESAVIGKMVSNTLNTLEYFNYHVFVGTYPNDSETIRVADAVCASFPNVHRTVCPKDGPTNKADCLNWIYQGILAFERENDIHFEIFVMEDCEDIVHPLCLKLFNYLIPRKDMVQLPVFPLERGWREFSSGHYIDEFAENHSKDMWVRERLTEGIPAAGVGCAFGRAAMDHIAGQNNNQIFSIDSLTEDYEFGLRLRSYNLKGIFVSQKLELPNGRKRTLTSGRATAAAEFVAVREYFPSTFRTAVRQKARWVLGIALQGWSHLGWRGGFWTRYMFLRDRKTLVTSQVNVFGYAVVLVQCWVWLMEWLMPDGYRYPPIVEQGSFLWTLLAVDAIFLVERLAWRIGSVYRLYGWGQALLSIPRQAWANFINAAAVYRALYMYARYLMTGVLVKWDKTAHVFPSEQELAHFHRKLGELLVEQKLISLDDLEEALAWQRESKHPLGRLLVRLGAIREEELTRVLSEQLNLPVEHLDAASMLPEVIELVPRELAVRYSVFPVRVLADGRLLLATADRLKPQSIMEVETTLKRKISLCLVTRSQLGLALRFGYSYEGDASLCQTDDPARALAGLRSDYRRVGDILLDEEMVSSEALESAVHEYASCAPGFFGDYLVRKGLVTPEQLRRALGLQSPAIHGGSYQDEPRRLVG